jgi:hypothetical protein
LITFLYFSDMAEPSQFFEQVLELEPVVTESFARIYRLSSTGYVGVVVGSQGFLQAKSESAVLTTLVVRDVDGWYQRLAAKGVKLLSELKLHPEIQIRGFFFEGPGGYKFEVQEFLRPEAIALFHQGR